jgi:hypothetical protein
MVLFLNSFRLYSFLGSVAAPQNSLSVQVFTRFSYLLVFAALQAYPFFPLLSSNLFFVFREAW